MSKSAKEIAAYVGGRLIGGDNLEIAAITHIDAPVEGAVAFVQDAKSLKKMESSAVACLIVPREIEKSSKPLIQVDHPKLAWARLLELFHPAPKPSGQIAAEAVIAGTAKIGQNVTIGPFVHIDEGAEIGDGCVIGSHTYIGSHVKIGQKSVLHAGVTVYHGCRIGNRVILHAKTVIGTDGFGYVATPKGQIKVPQVGIVIIEDDVEIGASTTIDRGTIGHTRIGQGCKIDNLVQIAHNVEIGAHTVISSQTGISGSCKIGSHVTMGGKVGVGDHVEIGDWVMVGAGAGLPTGKKVPPKQVIFGEPARPYQAARKQIAAQLRSAEMYEEIKKLRKQVAALEKHPAQPGS